MSVPLGRMLREISSLVLPASSAPPDLPVRGVCHDSRRVGPGDLFVACRGHRSDGHSFLGEAAARGAAALVGEAPEEEARAQVESKPEPLYIRVTDSRRALGLLSSAVFDHPSRSLRLVGVTGTNGKTSVTWMCHAAFSACGLRSAVLGTLGSGRPPLGFDSDAAGGPGWNPAVHTTPEAPDLQEALAAWRDSGVEAAAMEVSSHGLELRRSYGTRFACAVFTNLSPEHLDFHGTLDGYRNAKSRLFRREERGPEEPPLAAVVNGDDPQAVPLLEGSDDTVLRFGRGEGCDLRPLEVETGPAGIRIRLEARPVAGFTHGRLEAEIRSPLLGGFQVDNLLAAFGAGLALELPPDAVAEGLGRLTGIPGRMERVDPGGTRPVLVDYAHTPEALERAIAALRPFVPGRILLVFGCGGERDREKRPKMGRIAVTLADRVWLTDDNPRTEDPASIRREVRSGMEGAGGTWIEEGDRTRAIAAAMAEARSGDAVLLAGKGAETAQIQAVGPVPFDDREVARRCLGEASR